MEDRERDLERELQSHLDAEAAEQRESGITPEAARYAAQRALGNTAVIQEEVRDVWAWTRLEQFDRDVHYALRAMRRNKGFTLVALLSLALGIGSTTSVFSVMNAVMLRPLPAVEAPEGLVSLEPQLRTKRFALFHPVFEHVRAEQRLLTGLFAVSDDAFLKASLEGSAAAFVPGSMVSGNYFEVLQVKPALGRLLEPGDDRPEAPCVATVSHRFWKERLGSSREALGRTLTVRDKLCTIAGVTEPEFQGHQHAFPLDVWLPIRQMTDPKLLASKTMAFYSGVMGRLRPGVSRAEAQSELTGIYQRYHAAQEALRSPFPGDAAPTPGDFAITLSPGAQGLEGLRRPFQQPLLLALAVVGVVLLIAAVNVAGLVLARGVARHAELSTRAALGASRFRLLRQLTLEGFTLTVCGGLLGVMLAFVGTPALASLISRQLDISPDIRVAGVAIGVTLLAALVAGVLPALRLSASVVPAARTVVGPSSQKLPRTLVVAQLALSLILVASASLLLRSLYHVVSVDPGFNPGQVVMMDVRDTEPAARYGDTDPKGVEERRYALYREMDRRLNGIAGVQSASLSWLGLFGGNYVGVNVYDTEQPAASKFTLTDYVSPRYFETVGMRLLRGRIFAESDREGAQRVAIVNEAFVRERVPQGEVIGRNLVMTYATDKRPFTIVGVLRDAKYNDLREKKADPMMWVPLAQVPTKIRSVCLRVQPGMAASVTKESEAAMRAISPHFMVRRSRTLQEQVDGATLKERMLLKVTGGFAALALLLSAIGLYGTLAYAVNRRTREIGVRVALGATRQTVISMVLRESMALVIGGLLVGLPLSFAAGRLLRGFLFGIEPHDPWAWLSASAILIVVAIVAAVSPARRASRVDPVVALKYE